MNTSNITNYKPKDFAELLGVSVKTLQRWDREVVCRKVAAVYQAIQKSLATGCAKPQRKITS